ncbi:MAG TPA: arsenate reductase ArsC, partial [Prolixibacteraceae bacterium]|nr:arsenate reductase ArsC [Prolixibacteraceae bacterium]
KGKLNPLVVEALKEIGIDISNNETKSVFKLFKQGRIYHYVITVCDAASAEHCPLFPGMTKRLHWSFEDPASFTGTDEEKLAKIRVVRDSIKIEVNGFVKNIDLLT